MNKSKSFFYDYGGWLSKRISIGAHIRRTGIKIIFPFYHAVSDEVLPHIKNLYAYPSLKKFKTDLDFILKYFEPLHPDELGITDVTALKNKFLLTFDDGLREMHDIVAPVLKEKGVPAIFFINSGFTDNRDLFYRYKVSLVMSKTGDKNLLNLKYADRPVIDAAAEKAGIDFKEFLALKKPYLTTEQIKSMGADGFIFGGHSIDHPQYSRINADEQIRQTIESVKYVQQITGQKKNYFAFPFTDEGVSENFYNSVFSNAETQIDFTFGTAGLRMNSGRTIQRFPMEIRDLSAEQIVKNEYGYYSLKKMFGK